MFYGHNLRSDIQEWRSRLYKSSITNFHNEYRQFFLKIRKVLALTAIIQNAIDQFGFSADDLAKFNKDIESSGDPLLYENGAEQAAIIYLLHERYFGKLQSYHLIMTYGA